MKMLKFKYSYSENKHKKKLKKLEKKPPKSFVSVSIICVFEPLYIK